MATQVYSTRLNNNPMLQGLVNTQVLARSPSIDLIPSRYGLSGNDPLLKLQDLFEFQRTHRTFPTPKEYGSHVAQFELEEEVVVYNEIGEKKNHENLGFDNLWIGWNLLHDVHTSACHRSCGLSKCGHHRSCYNSYASHASLLLSSGIENPFLLLELPTFPLIESYHHYRRKQQIFDD
ncbi:hypothetical protein Tco_0741031, partial [Tanacetum coccineum]